jgi:uncharacterized membrane protein YtjA (UPF0391 family)
MFYWTVVFMVLAIVAAVLGFGQSPADAGLLAKATFVTAVTLFVAALLGSALNLRR